MSVAAFAALAAAGLALDAATLRFKTAAQVSGGMVRLADVADVLDADEALGAKLRGVTLAPAPAAGKSVRLDHEQIRSRLTAQGIDVSDIQFSGRSVVQVTGPSENLTAAKSTPQPEVSDVLRETAVRRVSQAIAEHVGRKSPQLGKVSVSVSLSPEQVAVLAKSGAELAVSGDVTASADSQSLTMQVTTPRAAPQSIRVACRISPLPRLVHVRRVIRAGQILTSADLELAGSSAESTDRRTLLTVLREAVGQETQRTLRPGEPVSRQDLRKVLLVQRGNPVTIVSRVGAIMVSMVGKAEGDAAMGEAVSVTPLDRKQRLTGWVTGYHEVTVSRPETDSDQRRVATQPGERDQ